jgi:precorrin-6Y C5,15-methyltransferase (decarboxylating)
LPLIGILDDGWAGLSDAPASDWPRAADLVIGAGRTLDWCGSHLPRRRPNCRTWTAQLGQVPGWIWRPRMPAKRSSCWPPATRCATASPLADRQAGPRRLRDPAGSVDAATGLRPLQTPWQDIKISSCHTADAGEWFVGATPAHGLYKLMRAIALHPRVALFTGPENNPARLARALITAGYGDEVKLSVACRLLLPDEAVFAGLAAVDVENREFPEPNVVLVERSATDASRCRTRFRPRRPRIHPAHAPEKGLITKQEARACRWPSCAGARRHRLGHRRRFRLGRPRSARLAPHGHVWAIEKERRRCRQRARQRGPFPHRQLHAVEGKAPEQLDTWPDPDAVFIGGSGGELAELIRLILARLKPGWPAGDEFRHPGKPGHGATRALAEAGAVWDVVQLQASRSQPILDMHRLAAQNPVWIVTASKENEA